MSPTPRPGAQVQGNTHCKLSPRTRDPRAPTKKQRDVGGDLEGESWCPQRPTAADSPLKASGTSSVVMLGCWLPSKAPGLSPGLLVSSQGSLQVKCSCDSLKDPPFSERKKCALARLAFSLSPIPTGRPHRDQHCPLCALPEASGGKELSVARGTPPCSAQQQAAGI